MAKGLTSGAGSGTGAEELLQAVIASVRSRDRTLFIALQHFKTNGFTGGTVSGNPKQELSCFYFLLTVQAHRAGSHRGIGWEEFTDAAIRVLNDIDRPMVFILWGRPAQMKKPMLTNPNHLILEAPHPSPLSAYRGFFGSRPFSQTNRFLEEHGIAPIDWQIEDI